MTKRFTAGWLVVFGALLFTILLVLSGGAPAPAKEPEAGKAEAITRGAVTGQTKAQGYNHPNQSSS